MFPLPFESPSDGDRELVRNAADPDASPFGWHDTDGVEGPEFMTTQGNNVHAYADRNADNIADPGSDPDGGPELVFDFPLDLGIRPFDSQPAMVTNLFYWNNIMHDVTYDYGFDEASGNFQVNNYGNGGLGDGLRPGGGPGRKRPQQRELRNAGRRAAPADADVRVALGGSEPDRRSRPVAHCGHVLRAHGGIRREPRHHGADRWRGRLRGRGCDPAYQAAFLQRLSTPTSRTPLEQIALIDRGICTFVAKVKKAQDVGAHDLVIVAQQHPGTGHRHGRRGSDHHHPVRDDQPGRREPVQGERAASTSTVSDGTGGDPDRDSDLDSGVIAHEYGHGVSNRLTGGPATVACLQNNEQMGEGWSDWFALNLTTHPDDTPSTPRGVGSYVIFQPPDGVGIRPTPYTTDMTVNPSTYASVADVANIVQPHGIGYVWNTMLWEMYWNLVDRHGYNDDIYDSWWKGGNNLALQLVMDGMKLQPCSPGFVDGRNAILTADSALTGGKNQCEIWRAFAKRGLGFSANQGLSTSRTDGVAAFDLPASCTTAVFGGFRPPVDDPPEINHANAGRTIPVKFTLTGVASHDLVIDSQEVDCNTLEPTGDDPEPVDADHFRRRGDSFQFNWDTKRSWEDTCRRLTIRIPAPSDAYAYFKFH